jgi:hypothetical protein
VASPETSAYTLVGADGRIILKTISESSVKVWIKLNWLR